MTVDWWVTLRDAKPVRDAIVGAFLQHWLPVVENAIKANKQRQKQPKTWEQLALALDRNFASLWRTKKGRVRLSWYDAQLMAEILELRIEQLTPTRETWLPVATQLLCGESGLPLSAAQAYSFYRMADVEAFDPLDEACLASVAEQMEADFPTVQAVGGAILEAAERVGERLELLVPDESSS